MSDRIGFVQRLDGVEERLAGHAASEARHALTSPDPGTGERWEAGDVWAHVAEFIPYWIAQAETVIGAEDSEPLPFGRTKSDSGRLAAIARDRTQRITVLWSVAHNDIERLRQFLLGLDSGAWAARGLHPTRGVMDVEHIVDEFLVGHLEEHAEQLDELARDGG